MNKHANLDPNFIFFDGVSQRHLNQIEKDAKPALSEAERYSLVKTSKCPTPQVKCHHPRDWPFYDRDIETDLDNCPSSYVSREPGHFTIIQHRAWSNEYRIRTSVEMDNLSPPLNIGTRRSTRLSNRGARCISDSCTYMAKCKGGYQTFVTGTFDAKARKRIDNGETTIQKEVTRTMDALQKMYQRGWTTSEGERLGGHKDALAYCWVVEIPENNERDGNPHIHMMLGWSVPFDIFGEWCERIESIWGNGFFHLEKIRNPESAGAYMAKAAGYMTKANKNESQGTVKGNRYGISKISRAPKWRTEIKSELGIMGRLIAEIHINTMLEHGHLFEDREKLKKALVNCSKNEKGTRIAIGNKLEKIRETIRSIPIITSKYQIIFKDETSFNRFIGSSIAAGWNHSNKPITMFAAALRKRFENTRKEELPIDYCLTDREWIDACKEYSSYSYNSTGCQ